MFSETGFLLQQEGSLAQACLCNGLTALRRANVGDKKGFFYSAFFELSIGFERTLKLVLIIDHMAQHKLTPPNGSGIKNYGHKLMVLFEAAKAVCATRGLNSLQAFTTDSLPMIILAFLDNFAHPDGRYANINNLTGHKNRVVSDPIARWGEIADRIIREKATNRQRQQAVLNGQIATAFGDGTVSFINDLDQQRLSVPDLFTRAAELETAAKHATFALVELIAALRDVLDTICKGAWAVSPPGSSGLEHVPMMAEFFQFAWADRPYVMRKRQWP